MRRIAQSALNRSARAQGKAARAAGMTADDCPYKPGSHREVAWKEGFAPEIAERLPTKGKADEPQPVIIGGVCYASRAEARRNIGWEEVLNYRRGRDVEFGG